MRVNRLLNQLFCQGLIIRALMSKGRKIFGRDRGLIRFAERLLLKHLVQVLFGVVFFYRIACALCAVQVTAEFALRELINVVNVLVRSDLELTLGLTIKT